MIKNSEIGSLAKAFADRCRDQALERKPSNAWARKMLALIKHITAVTISIIAKSIARAPRGQNNCGLAQSKGFALAGPTIRPDW